MLDSEFEKELTALFKKHGITSISMLCYNDPDEVAKYNEEMEAYNEQLEAWQDKYAEWVKTNPEVEGWSPRYTFYGNRVDGITYSEVIKKYDTWHAKRDADIGPEPQEPEYDLIKEEYDDEEYTPGIWYSSIVQRVM